MRKIILSLFTLLFVILYGQQGNQNLQLPTIIPPSPTAQNFMRYGEIPVDYSTGVPSIDIPLHTIKGKKLTLPLSISYHASGIKVNDIASEIGLGWVFNGKGLISRTANGKRDEAKSTVRRYNNSAHLLQDLEEHYLDYECTSRNYIGVLDRINFYKRIFVDEQDAMSDRYFYKIPGGESGVFVYDYSVFSENENSVVTLPYRPIKIKRNFSYIQNNSPTQDATFEITDENGNIYTFSPYTVNDNSSEWYVTQILSADETEKIIFNYTKQAPPSGTSVISTVYRGRVENYNNEPCTASDIYGSISYEGTPVPDFTTPILNSIVTDSEIITFIYDSRNDYPQMKRLKSISVSPKATPDIVRKKIQFYEKYFGSTDADRRLALDYLTISSPNGNGEIEKYSFKYNENTMLPPYPLKISPLRFNEDLWGYANGHNKTTNVPRDYINNNSEQTTYGANRDADTWQGLASACMLQEIKYPTGGKTVFEFERFFSDNLYSYREYDHEKKGYLGGFRVKQISSYKNESDLNPEIKSYVYNGAIYKAPHFKYFRRPQTFQEEILMPQNPNEGYEPTKCYPRYTVDLVFSSPFLSMDVAPGLPIMYTSVTEYKGTLVNNAGKTIYSYGDPYSPAEYESQEHPDLYEAPWYYHPYHYDKGNFVPQLIKKEVYDSMDRKMYMETNHYNSYFKNTFTTGIKLSQDINYINGAENIFLATSQTLTSGCCQCTAPSNTCSVGGACIEKPLIFKNSIVAIDTKAIQESTLLNYSIKRTYDPNNENKYVDDRIDYLYNQHNLMVKEASRTNTLGENILTEYKYPYDFGTSSPYNTMLAKNILTPVIEQTTTNTSRNRLVEKVQTAYDGNWGNNIIEPILIKSQNNGTLEDRIRFMSYDRKGNVTSLKKEGDIPITYIWGYDRTLPIAKVENSNLVSQQGTYSQDIPINMNIDVPMGNTEYELGSFSITEEKTYKIERNYEKYPIDKTVEYTILFKNVDDSSGTVSFKDNAPAGGNPHTFTTAAQLLKPGNYEVKLVNLGYNTYQGSIEHTFNFTVYNTVTMDKTIPFHTSFEEDVENVSTTEAKTGTRSHIGHYYVKIPPASLGYEKVIVSYWKKDGSSTWEYVENTVDVNGQDYYIPSYSYIDEVRMYPVGALMTTYAYDPFYRQPTSIMKPNNQGEYYRYDGQGRLIDVHDENGDLLSEYEYHYRP